MEKSEAQKITIPSDLRRPLLALDAVFKPLAKSDPPEFLRTLTPSALAGFSHRIKVSRSFQLSLRSVGLCANRKIST
jgi:hypothetical protein